jgi:hypothetical protein
MAYTYTLSEKFGGGKAGLITEDLDEEDLRLASRVFDQIDRIMGDAEIPSIDQALDDARDALSKLLSGEGSRKDKILAALTGKKRRTLQNIMDVQVQLVSLFRKFPQVMSLAGKNLGKKIKDIGYTRENEPGRIDTPDIVQKSVRDAMMEIGGEKGANIVDRMEALIKKALTPGFLKKAVIDPDQATSDILNMKLEDFRALVQRAGGQNIKVGISPDDLEKIQGSEKESEQRTADYLNRLKGTERKQAEKLRTTISRVDPEAVRQYDDMMDALIS